MDAPSPGTPSPVVLPRQPSVQWEQHETVLDRALQHTFVNRGVEASAIAGLPSFSEADCLIVFLHAVSFSGCVSFKPFRQ